MKVRKYYVTVLIATLFCFVAQSQSQADFNMAEATAKEAIALFNRGEVKLADSMIRSSIRLYPTRLVCDYAAQLARSPDIAGSNLVMDALLNRVKNFERAKMSFREVGFMNRETLVEIPLELAKFKFAKEILNVNKAFANHGIVERSMIKALEQPVPEGKKSIDRIMYFTVKLELAIHQGKYDEAFAVNDEMKKEKLAQGAAYTIVKSSILTEKGAYNKAIAELKGEKSADFLLFMNYALLGESDKALESYENYKKKSAGLGTFFGNAATQASPREEYYLALIDMNRKFYSAALEKLTKSIEGRASAGMDVYRQEPLWKVYKLMGDAYTGLKQYDKARDNYSIALLSYPGYQPASDGMTKLESLLASEISIDKTPPSITVTEPSLKRGLKITASGNDIMVKGIAPDPSGLKSVFVNGQAIYSQPAGNFWGNVNLKNGTNKILIKVTDGAGNSAEESFEITKNAATASETDIIPVVTKDGKNYCLLIASQNYKDASIPSLDNPIQDATRLKLVLKNNYHFSDDNIITLFNPEANDIKRQLLELTNTIQPEDNLLIFYAGHGIWVEKEKKGYWLMTDAKRNDPNTWVSNKDVLNLIAKLPSRHTLLITDACFSGGVFKTRAVGKDASASIKMMDEKISRVAITSGNDTEVPDESVFMRYLVKALTENKDKYMPAQKMFISYIMEAVMAEGKTEPRYGTLELAGHVGGDYIFIKK